VHRQDGVEPRRPGTLSASDTRSEARTHRRGGGPGPVGPYHAPTVSGLCREDVAERAGVDVELVVRLQDLGVLARSDEGTFSRGDVRRVRMVHGIEQGGIPVETLVTAIRRGDLSLAFLDLELYERFSQLSDQTFQELSAGRGIPFDLLKVLRESIGLAPPRPEDLVREDELQVLPLIELHLSMGFRPAVIERWLRVYGESLRRIAETESDWWHTEIDERNIASGLSVADSLEAMQRPGEEMAPLTVQALLAIYYAQQEHTWTDNFIDVVEGALDRSGLKLRPAQLPAICFLDITGYTRLTEERGDEAAAALATRLTGLVQQGSERHRGKVVRWLGDGVMLHFREPRAAVSAALELIEEVSGSGLPPAHVGIHAGPMVFQGGDYFGRTVNVAARIAEFARPGELLVSQDVAEATELGGVTFTEIGPIDLKGVSEPMTLHSVRRQG
jgi:class 3 adenylate cyclase